MAQKIPDEILKEILSPVLNVEDESFADTNDPSPFSLKSYSNSDILLVCKQWLRVATPLLYHVVILRSTAQTQALAHALMKNRELGLFIKKIRLEGGFGASVHKIIVAAPNIKDIFLSLKLWSSDSVTGLCKGLPLMDPSRLVLQDNEYMTSFQQSQLFTTLCECLKTWKNLTIIDFPYEFKRSLFFEALMKSPSIERLYFQETYDMHYLRTLAEIPSLKAIIVRTTRPNALPDDIVNGHPKLMALIQYKNLPPSTLLPMFWDLPLRVPIPADSPFDPDTLTPSPMSPVSGDVQDKIWSRVLEFALEIQLLNGKLDYRAHFRDRTRGRLLLVSKQFRILAIPFLYRFPMLFSTSALTSFANQLVFNPSLALHIRSLFVSDQGSSTTKDMYQILSRTSGLVQLRSDMVRWDSLLAKMDWDGFNALAKSSGSTLLTLHNFEIDMPPSRQSPSVFNGFVKLRSLWWNCKTVFEVDCGQISCASLAALERIHFNDYDESFPRVLSLMELPSLLHVRFSYTDITNALPFLHRHGFKIHTLDLRFCLYDQHPVFDMCPNMEFLSISTSQTPDSLFFRCSTENNKLVKINLDVSFNPIINLFETINWDGFKCLTEIQSQFCKWPTTEHEIAEDSWHVWAEILLKWGVKLTDSEGRHWRPRLKLQHISDDCDCLDSG